jgi:hypothetical protein
MILLNQTYIHIIKDDDLGKTQLDWVQIFFKKHVHYTVLMAVNTFIHRPNGLGLLSNPGPIDRRETYLRSK